MRKLLSRTLDRISSSGDKSGDKSGDGKEIKKDVSSQELKDATQRVLYHCTANIDKATPQDIIEDMQTITNWVEQNESKLTDMGYYKGKQGIKELKDTHDSTKSLYDKEQGNKRFIPGVKADPSSYMEASRAYAKEVRDVQRLLENPPS